MTAPVFSKDQQDFLRALAKHEVRYLVIGGHAVIFHGFMRFTGDIDFLYDCNRENAERLWAALLELWHGNVPVARDAADLMNPDVVFQFGRPPNRIDLIASLSSVPFERAWATRVKSQFTVDGVVVPVWILGLAELRRAKQEAGRLKDLEDLKKPARSLRSRANTSLRRPPPARRFARLSRRSP